MFWRSRLADCCRSRSLTGWDLYEGCGGGWAETVSRNSVAGNNSRAGPAALWSFFAFIFTRFCYLSFAYGIFRYLEGLGSYENCRSFLGMGLDDCAGGSGVGEFELHAHAGAAEGGRVPAI